MKRLKGGYDSPGFSRNIGRCVVALVCYAGLGLSQATTVTLSQFPPNPGVMPGGGWEFNTGTTFANPPPPRAWVNGVYGSVPKYVATDVVSVAGRAGALPVAAVSAVGLGEAALAVGRCVLGANIVCAAGSLAWQAYKIYRALPPKDVPGGSALPKSTWDSVFDFDPGKPPAEQETVVWNAFWNADHSSPHSGNQGSAEAACSVVWSNAAEQDRGTGSAYVGARPLEGSNPPSYDCVATRKNRIDSNGNVYYAEFTFSSAVASVSKGLQCKGEVDFSNPAYDVPDMGPIGPDGKCPTARYNHVGLTPQEIADKIVSNPPEWPAAQGTPWERALPDAIDKGGQTVPSDLTTNGPQTQSGTPSTSTTTTSSGTTTTTKTPVYNYTYNGNTVTYNTSTVTVTNNGGNTTTTVDAPAGAAPQDPSDPCTANPNRAGCMELGSAPSDAVPKKNPTLTYTAEDVAMPSGCPAPVTIQVAGHTQVVSYAQTCDAVTQARPFIIASAAFASLMLVLAALRGI